MTRRQPPASASIRTLLPALLAAAAALGAHPTVRAQADPEVTYAGIGAGLANYKYRNNPGGGTDICGVPGQFSCEDAPAGFKLFAGYNITRFIGIEGSYYNTGRASITFNAGSLGNINQKVVLSGYSLSAVGTLPLGPAAFLAGRLGVSAASVNRKDEIGGVSTSRDRTKTQAAIGVSGGATVWRNVAIRLDWDRYRGETSLGEKFEANLITLNALYRFN